MKIEQSLVEQAKSLPRAGPSVLAARDITLTALFALLDVLLRTPPADGPTPTLATMLHHRGGVSICSNSLAGEHLGCQTQKF